MMNTYVILEDNTVIAISQVADEITHPNFVKIPEYDATLIGKIYDKQSGLFENPPAVRIRKISKGAFRRRLTTAEKVAIKTSTDPVVKVLEDDLLVTSFVDLDFQSLIDGIDYLIAINILTPARKAELLKDGEQHEI